VLVVLLEERHARVLLLAEAGDDGGAQRRLELLVLLEHTGLQAHVLVNGVAVVVAVLERIEDPCTHRARLVRVI